MKEQLYLHISKWASCRPLPTIETGGRLHCVKITSYVATELFNNCVVSALAQRTF